MTAAHVVVGAQKVQVRYPDKKLRPARADARLVGGGTGPDLALLDVDDEGIDLPAIELAVVDRDSPAATPVEGCHAVGYPWFAETPSPSTVRDTVDAWGYIPVLSNLASGLLTVQVTNSPEPLPPERTALGDSQWSGMSGAPVIAGECLLGVVSEHALRAGPSAITAVPLSALEPDPAHPEWGPGVSNASEWWARLGVTGLKGLRRLPARKVRVEPAYWATVREIHERTPHLLGRGQELAKLTAFATGAVGYRWLTGGPWTGKTALLAEMVTALPGDVDVVCYFLSRREADADSSRFLAAVIPQLADVLDEDPPAGDVHQFRALWQRAAERADTEGRPLLLVVDGLDEDLRPPGLPSVAALLPVGLGRLAHVLVTSRPYPELPADIPAGHPLREKRPVPVSPFSGARELAALARQEIDDLLRHDDDGLAADVLGLLTAAAGPLAVRDLAAMTTVAPQSAALARRIRRLVTSTAARSLQAAGLNGGDRYQFAHESLLAYAQADDDLNDPDFRHRIHEWADSWGAAGWPPPARGEKGTPRYLLDTYPATLTQDSRRLTQLATDIGWVDAVIASEGIDSALANLRRASAAAPASTGVAEVLATVAAQAHNLRPPQPLDEPGYILRQLSMQAAELGADDLAAEIRSRFLSLPGPCLVPRWTTRRISRAMSGELGRHSGPVRAVAVLADGRVLTGGQDGQVLAWDPDRPGTSPAGIGQLDSWVNAMAVLADGRVVTAGEDGRVLVWDPDRPGITPAELGRHTGVYAAAVLADGQVVTGGHDGQVLAWDPDRPGTSPAGIGQQDGEVWAVAVLADGRVVSSGQDGRVLAWDPDQPGTSPAELGQHGSWVYVVAVLADGRVVTGGNDRWALAWDPDRPGTSPAGIGHHDREVTAVAVMVDGRIVTGGPDGRMLVWDPDRPGSSGAEMGYDDRGVNVVAVLADGRVVTGDPDGRVLVWDPDRPRTSPAESDHRYGQVEAVAVLGDGRVVTGDRDGRVLVWDPNQPGTSPAELRRHDDWVVAVAVLGDGRVVTGGWDGRVLVWDPNQPGTSPAELGHHSGEVNAVAVLNDGRVVTGGREGGVLVWDPDQPGTSPAELGAELGHHDRGVNAVAVLNDGRVVTGGTDGQLLVWDPDQPRASPAELGYHRIEGDAIAVLADGRVVTGGYDDGLVLVWDPDQLGISPTELGRHDHWGLGQVAVLADGLVVTGGYHDRRVLVWDPARAGSPVLHLSSSVTALATAALGPARSNLVIAHEGSGCSLWSFTG